MSKSALKKVEKMKKQQEIAIENQKQKVKMKFKEDKFYNDLQNPLYEAGKVYEIVGGDMIQRWLKRGGEIVEGELKVPENKVNPSVLVEDKKEVVDDKPVVEEESDYNEEDAE